MNAFTATSKAQEHTLRSAFGAVARSWAKAAIIIGVPVVLCTTLGSEEIIDMNMNPSNPSVCMPTSGNNYCAPAGDIKVATTISEMESKGMKCSDAAVLTDSIIFQFEADKSVRVVGFDEAMALSKDSQGWVQSFCK